MSWRPKNWRPKNWYNPHTLEEGNPIRVGLNQAFEEGANAMLEAMGDLREKIAIELNWYSEPYKDWYSEPYKGWQTLSETERALWRARADALLDLIMTDLQAGASN